MHPFAPPIAQAIFESPLGPLLAVASEAGLTGLWFDAQQHHPGRFDLPEQPRQRWIAAARQQLGEYFAGRRQRFDLALAPGGTPFQLAVWHALLALPSGATGTYGGIAQAIGRPSAVRAVGAAVGRNPIGIIVPCHRVIGRDGSLTGYAGGLERKVALLRLEAEATPLEVAA